MLSSAIQAREMRLKLAKLKTFEVNNAECHDSDDREAILALIADW